MRVIGWIALSHVLFIIAWMVFNIVFSMVYPVTMEDGTPLREIGLEYHSSFIGYLAIDHGSKSLMMLLTIMVPIGTYYLLKEDESRFGLPNLVGLIAGTTGFILYSLSLMLQAVSVAYAINLYNENANEFAVQFALHIYEWTMLEGGFSTSIYILSNLLIALWMVLHSRGLYGTYRKLSVIGIAVGLLHMIAYFISWMFLMFGNQTLHTFTEAVGLLFLLWIGMLGFLLIKKGK